MIITSSTSPVFIVGLPRSGSTLLSRLLNRTEDIICVNDLYFLQAVEACGGFVGKLSPDQVGKLAEMLLDVISKRSEAKNKFIGQFSLGRVHREEILAAVTDRGASGTLTWSELMQFIMGRVAEYLGKVRWADKTPQNFMHVERLASAFPATRFVFLMRDPRSVLLSFKHASGEGHDQRRYHPLAYAIYWRMAVDRYNELRPAYGKAMLLLRYEDLTGQPIVTCRILGDFLGTTIHVPPLDTLGHNSSFATRRRLALTKTETWICEKLCRTTMEQLGYTTSAAQPRLRDITELIRLSMRFSMFQLRRTIGDRDGRKRIINVLRRLLRSQSPASTPF